LKGDGGGWLIRKTKRQTVLQRERGQQSIKKQRGWSMNLPRRQGGQWSIKKTKRLQSFKAKEANGLLK